MTADTDQAAVGAIARRGGLAFSLESLWEVTDAKSPHERVIIRSLHDFHTNTTEADHLFLYSFFCPRNGGKE